MKVFVAALAVAASALLLPGLASAPAQAEGATAARSATPSDVSAARRKHHHRTTTQYAPPPRAMWNGGADPGRGPGSAEFRRMQSEGRCVIDEGYGRWTSCSNE